MADARCLHAMRDHKPHKIRELCEVLHLRSTSTVHARLQKLVRLGLVERTEIAGFGMGKDGKANTAIYTVVPIVGVTEREGRVLKLAFKIYNE